MQFLIAKSVKVAGKIRYEDEIVDLDPTTDQVIFLVQEGFLKPIDNVIMPPLMVAQPEVMETDVDAQERAEHQQSDEASGEPVEDAAEKPKRGGRKAK